MRIECQSRTYSDFHEEGSTAPILKEEFHACWRKFGKTTFTDSPEERRKSFRFQKKPECKGWFPDSEKCFPARTTYMLRYKTTSEYGSWIPFQIFSGSQEKGKSSADAERLTRIEISITDLASRDKTTITRALYRKENSHVTEE
uniref:Uncharacterized protein n=1 Tax=Candidatus Kentrum sp. LFY TaxID=2126342 RepID=A0A450U5D4_9GAMM|nr:MAG: hypothetical protein BECKLFY1418B_GA0070995_10035 [Candidatus Kentron sp. LFY]